MTYQKLDNRKLDVWMFPICYMLSHTKGVLCSAPSTNQIIFSWKTIIYQLSSKHW